MFDCSRILIYCNMSGGMPTLFLAVYHVLQSLGKTQISFGDVGTMIDEGRFLIIVKQKTAFRYLSFFLYFRNFSLTNGNTTRFYIPWKDMTLFWQTLRRMPHRMWLTWQIPVQHLKIQSNYISVSVIRHVRMLFIHHIYQRLPSCVQTTNNRICCTYGLVRGYKVRTWW